MYTEFSIHLSVNYKVKKLKSSLSSIISRNQDMSIIIELEEQENQQQFQNSRFFKESLKAIFKRQYSSECKNIDDIGKQISFFIHPSQNTYRLSSLWHFQLDKPIMTVRVSFYNKLQNDFLRAIYDRIKIETYILIRMINSTMTGYQFRIDSQSGILRIEYCLAWTNLYKVFSKQQNIYNFIKTLFHLFRKYDELMMILDSSFHNQKDLKLDNQIKINKLKCIMNQRKSMRKGLQSSIGDILRLKDSKQILPAESVCQLKKMFYQSISLFYQTNFQQPIQEYNMANLQRQIATIQKNQTGFLSSSSHKYKIVLGLLNIKEETQSNDAKLAEEGGHSKIFKNRFRYSVVDTINKGTISFQPGQWRNKTKQSKGDLAFKICNIQRQSSVNSFKNQLAILRYLKQDFSPYIARYYLLLKEKWDEKDTIYMTIYRDNIFSMLNKHVGILWKTKLTIAYGIAKGMCFLSLKGIVHRDFKPHNILVDSSMTPKIIDFGSSAPKHNTLSVNVYDQRLLYTQGYHIPYDQLNPKIRAKFTRDAYDKHPLFDVYGFGRIICFIFFNTLSLPPPQLFAHDPNRQFLQHINFVVQMCLEIDPDDRPTFSELASYLGALPELLKSEIVAIQCGFNQYSKETV